MGKISANATLIPPNIRRIINRVHHRYVADCQRGERPAINDPRNVQLTAEENYELARSGYYPIPPDVIRLGMTPAEHQRQEILDTVAEQLPDAIMSVLGTIEV